MWALARSTTQRILSMLVLRVRSLLARGLPAGFLWGLLLLPGVDSSPSSHFSRSDVTTIRVFPVLGKRRFGVWSRGQGSAVGRARTGAKRRLAVCPNGGMKSAEGCGVVVVVE